MREGDTREEDQGVASRGGNKAEHERKQELKGPTRARGQVAGRRPETR